MSPLTTWPQQAAEDHAELFADVGVLATVEISGQMMLGDPERLIAIVQKKQLTKPNAYKHSSPTSHILKYSFYSPTWALTKILHLLVRSNEAV